MIIPTACQRCGETFDAHSWKAAYCSDRCRKAASRDRAKERKQAELDTAAPVTPDPPPTEDQYPVYEATRAELAAAGRERTALALGALALARQIDMLADSPGALPESLVRGHAAALARALQRTAGSAAAGQGGLADIIGGAGGLVVVRGGRS